ncbi:MAG: 3-deoxy-manno-octulosonate cytidylyltransferase [Chitinivibrionales bacterium]|nr:3-deoxy-manno-octulosonate cytidylyltransferase [Chitinivibrionales bacterium]
MSGRTTEQGILCVLPARFASVRLPGKPLLEVKGVPLIMWSYRKAQAAGVFAEVVVATDDERVCRCVSDHGGKAVMTSANHATGTDRVNEVAAMLAFGWIVNLQGDEPLLPEAAIRNFAEQVVTLDNNSLLTSVSNATIREKNDPNCVKAVLNGRNEALYFSRAPIPFDRGGQHNQAWRHTGIYGFGREALATFCQLPRANLEQREHLEQLRALEHGMTIKCLIHDYRAFGIDTPEDLQVFKALVNKQHLEP